MAERRVHSILVRFSSFRGTKSARRRRKELSI